MKKFILITFALLFCSIIYAQDFISTWETTTTNEIITIPTTGTGYNYTVNWGDGTSNTTHTDADSTTDAIHTYTTAGTHTVSISGAFPRIYFNNGGDKYKIKDVTQWGTTAWTSMEGAFYGCTNLQISATDAPDLSNVTSLVEMFAICSNFNTNINHWDVSTITDMSGMFNNANTFNQPLNNWDVSNVISMNAMFGFANTFNKPLNNWDVSNVINMNAMFKAAYAFNQSLNNWDVSNVINMAAMFRSAFAFNQSLNNWDVSNVITMIAMFNNAYAFNQPLNNWDVSNVINMNAMFTSTTSFDQDLGTWDISNVIDMNNMFFNTGLSIVNYDTTLIGWQTLDTTSGETQIPTNITFNGGSSTYCASETARTSLTETTGNGGYGWIITDAGLDCSSYTYVPDPNFENYLETHTANGDLVTMGDTTSMGNGVIDTYITTANINTVTSLNVSNKNIADLTGIEAFSALTDLYCNANQLTSLDVSTNTALITLNCSGNQLTSLDVSTNTALITLNCLGNQLTSLDVSTNTDLITLDCYANQLTSLNVSTNTALIYLIFGYNQLTSLDVSTNTALITLNLGYNQLTSLDVSTNTALTRLECDANQLTSLNVKNGNNSNLTFFYANNNPNLICIQVDDVAYSTANWTNIDPTASFSENCHYTETNIPDANFEAYLEANSMGNGIANDGYVTTANINTVTSLNIRYKNIADLTGIEAFIALTTLDCRYNDLTSLDVTANAVLEVLYCSKNDLTNLDVTTNLALTNLRVFFTQLISLDLSNNVALTNLNCSNNPLLSSLNLQNGYNENIQGFNEPYLLFNPNLTCIQVDDVAYSTTNWANIDYTASYSHNCANPETNIPDANFEAYLEANGMGNGIPNDGYVTISNIVTATTLNIDNKNIADLTGIEAFTALTTLDCSNNPLLTSLNLSINVGLTSLNFGDNTLLASVNLKNGTNTNISIFNALNTPSLTCIQVDDDTYSTTNWTNVDTASVFSIHCLETNIPDANFEAYLETHNANGNIVALGNLASMGNGIANDGYVLTANINTVTSLSVSNQNIADLTGIEAFTTLTVLNCEGNNLTNLDLSVNVGLTYLSFGNPLLTNLDLSANVNLISLGFSGSNLNILNLSANVELKELYCYANPLLTSLNVSTNVELKELYCDGNSLLTSLDLSTNIALTAFNCSNNIVLNSLNVKNNNNSSITFFSATNNPNLICIQVDDVAYSTANWTNIDIDIAFSTNCGDSDSLLLSAKVYLQGAALNPNTPEEDLMRDDLRVASLMPTTSPYTDALTIATTVLNTGGTSGTGAIDNDIVDWIWVELRDATDNTTIIDSQSALLQRDGDIVSLDGISPLSFNQASGDYYVVINHRNHLGIMSASTIALSETTTVVDFSNGDISTFGSNAQTISGMPIGVQGLWSGDVNGDAIVQYSGGFPDVPTVLSFVLNDAGNFLNLPTFSVVGYSNYDVDMNGTTQYTGSNSEPPIILQNVLVYPSNFLNLITFPIEEQLPTNMARYMQRRAEFINSKN